MHINYRISLRILSKCKWYYAFFTKNLKSFDSLYVTESLIKDHLKLGSEMNLSYYEYFLRIVRVTYYRTREMNEGIRN